MKFMDIHTKIGEVVIYLWPIVFVAVFILLTVLHAWLG